MSMSAKSTASARPVSSNKPQSRITLSQISRAGDANVRSRGVQTEAEARPPPVLPEQIPPLSSARGNFVRHAAEPEFPRSHERSVEFWYRDGNIIVNVEGTYFQLLLSRLERHCGYFDRISIDRAGTLVSGQKVVEVHDLKLRDFETFLKYLEVPMEHSVKDAPKEIAMSLMRASRVLSCKVIGNLAEARVFGPWLSASLPTPGDGLAGRPYREAIKMLVIAQGLNVPLVRKQTLYALLADDHFWSDVASRRAGVDISDADLLILYRTRAVMQEKWRVHILMPPNACLDSGCLPDPGSRVALWSGQMAHFTTTEVRDPLRSIEDVRTAVGKLANWCRVCVDERMRALEDAGEIWWKELDPLLGIVAPVA